jgi:uncharacterized protein
MRGLVLLALASLVIFGALGAAGCPPRAAPSEVHPRPRSSGPTDPVAPPGLFESRGAVVIDTPAGPLRFPVELALDDRERQRGLMFRDHLEEDTGMLFVFERPRVQSFWMKNTRIPLDMIFIDDGGEIVGIVESAEPMTLTSRSVDRASRYVLELNGGASRRLGIAPGQRVHFEGVPNHLVDPRLLIGVSPP